MGPRGSARGPIGPKPRLRLRLPSRGFWCAPW